MKKILKIIAVVLLAVTIGGGSFVVYKNTQDISYDISSSEKIGNDVDIIKEDVDSVTIKKNGDGTYSSERIYNHK